jgi:putative oxidoreductase
MHIQQNIAALLLRVALASGFLSAVASRLNLWGTQSSGWYKFVDYTAQMMSFIPKNYAPTMAILSTILEITFGLMLLLGYYTRYASFGAAALTLIFALTMSYSFGIKESFDYSVFVFSTGALLLATLPNHKWGIDNLFNY